MPPIAIKCIHCAGAVNAAEELFVCVRCGAAFPTTCGIPDFDRAVALPVPRLYDDPHYQTYLKTLAQAQDYFYRPGSLVSLVQHAGQRAVQAFMKGKSYDVVLDLGCGDGAFIPFLKNSGAYVGVDIDLESLLKIKRRYPNHFVLKGDCNRLPFGDASIDCIVSIYHLEHILNLDLVCEEMSRMLTEDGDLFVSVPNEGGFAWGMGRKISSARKFTTSTYDYMRAVSIAHVNCIWQLDKTIRRHFRVIRTSNFPFGFKSFHLNLITTYHLRKL